MSLFPKTLVPVVLCLVSALALADGPADNLAENVRPVPPVGVEIDAAKRTALTATAQELLDAITKAAPNLGPRGSFLSDVRVFHKAVDWALRYGEFFDPKQADAAAALLQTGRERLDALRNGQPSWSAASGLVVRGYRSRIDGSVQPYGLVIPSKWSATDGKAWPLHVWFHGRGEKLSELDFIQQRMKQAGEFAPEDAIVLHPYGRYCNGQRFAGETDFWEALAAVKQEYKIDENRIVVRGFSLGGAACWHIGTHFASKWAAVNPGAGFSETEKFLNFFQGETLQPQPWERKLWNLYDATAAAANLSNTNVIAYSGETDRQKQAADLMEAAMAAEGMKLQHIIGPQTAHKYEPQAKETVATQVQAWQQAGRKLYFSKPLQFVTYSLKYNDCGWAQIHALSEHWTEARITWQPDGSITTKNITALALLTPAGRSVRLDGNTAAPGLWHKRDGKWMAGAPTEDGLVKARNLQGPIDDAFMDAFLFVRPTGEALNPAVKSWVDAEMARAQKEWRRHFRGDARIKDDRDITGDEIKSYHLVLWGDPHSNSVLKKMAERLPLQWDASSVAIGKSSHPAANHVPILIQPNPLNPARYVVLNSGFTFREYDYLNNARQTPKLPDWAIVDISIPPNSRFPGKIVAADFFGENWQPKP